MNIHTKKDGDYKQALISSGHTLPHVSSRKVTVCGWMAQLQNSFSFQGSLDSGIMGEDCKSRQILRRMILSGVLP